MNYRKQTGKLVSYFISIAPALTSFGLLEGRGEKVFDVSGESKSMTSASSDLGPTVIPHVEDLLDQGDKGNPLWKIQKSFFQKNKLFLVFLSVIVLIINGLPKDLVVITRRLTIPICIYTFSHPFLFYDYPSPPRF